MIYFAVIPNYPSANLRHYHFLDQGFHDVEADSPNAAFGFIVRRPPHNSLEALLTEVNAALVIGDENPCREVPG